MRKERRELRAGLHILVSACLALCVPSLAVAERATLFVAASLKTAVDEIMAQSDVEMVASYASSSALARQIQSGAPAHIFISASEDWVDVLEADGLVVAGTRRSFLGNSLVVVGSTETADITLEEMPIALGDGRLSVALVDAVPAGRYAKAALQTLGLWDDLEPRLAQSVNVRAALALVSRQETPFGIVYETDARADPNVRIVARIPPDTHPTISYAIASVQDGSVAAAALVALTSPEAAAIYRKHGFMVTE
jgi:molybdate transport system substrate-binding protein